MNCVWRHIHGHTSLIKRDSMTVNSMLANRSLDALKLPGRYVPTAGGRVVDMAIGKTDQPNESNETHATKTTNISRGASLTNDPAAVADEYVQQNVPSQGGSETNIDGTCCTDAVASEDTFANASNSLPINEPGNTAVTLDATHMTRQQKRRLKHLARRAAKRESRH